MLRLPYLLFWPIQPLKERVVKNRFASFVAMTALLFVVLSGLAVGLRAHPAQTKSPLTSAPKTAGQAFKNIQVLKDIPGDQLTPSMPFITYSLGVECDFCHVEREFDKDDKKTKNTAREMMQMMFAINKNNFEGERNRVQWQGRVAHSPEPPGTRDVRFGRRVSQARRCGVLPAQLLKFFGELKLEEHTEKINGLDTSVVIGMMKGQPPVKFYFDQQTGLLLRMLHYGNTAHGLNPTQIDFADYREADGVKTPYKWTIAGPSGAFTIKADDVESNVPIDASRFVKPAPAPGPLSVEGRGIEESNQTQETNDRSLLQPGGFIWPEVPGTCSPPGATAQP